MIADGHFVMEYTLKVLYPCTCTKITEVNLSAFVYKLFDEDCWDPIVGTNLVLTPPSMYIYKVHRIALVAAQ